jgi:hypothetical protein
MKRRSAEERIAIPINGNPDTNFYTSKGLLLTKGYTRVVIGKRGPYIEFDPSQIERKNIHVPPHAEHKLDNDYSYYHEYRSIDSCFVKLYDQKLTVAYADYKIGMWYISPSDVKTDEFDNLVLSMYYEEPKPPLPPKEDGLFDIL